MPSFLHVCLQDWNHQGCCSEMASNLMVFWWHRGDRVNFWCGIPPVLTSLHLRTGALPFMLLMLLQWGQSPLRRRRNIRLAPRPWFCACCCADFCEGVGEAAKAPDRRGKANHLPDPRPFNCSTGSNATSTLGTSCSQGWTSYLYCIVLYI